MRNCIKVSFNLTKPTRIGEVAEFQALNQINPVSSKLSANSKLWIYLKGVSRSAIYILR